MASALDHVLNNTKGTLRRVEDLEAAILASGETVDLLAVHHFAEGTYTRELLIPAGVVLTGKIHRHSCINILAKGTIVVTDGGAPREISAPHTFVSPAGAKKAGFALTDVVWINVHPWVGEPDLELIEQQVIVPRHEPIEREDMSCLG
jgi:hypothetical protein